MITTDCTTGWEARTARGALIRTFSDRKQALKWWDDPTVDREGKFPGARLDEVITTTTVNRRSLKRPLALVRSA